MGMFEFAVKPQDFSLMMNSLYSIIISKRSPTQQLRRLEFIKLIIFL